MICAELHSKLSLAALLGIIVLSSIAVSGEPPPGYTMDPPVTTIQITPASFDLPAWALIPIEGPIKPGQEIEILDRLKGFQGVAFARVNSLGGDVGTAIKIGHLLRSLHASVSVPVDGVCASACIFIYAAGVRRSLSPGAKLVIHRPYLTGMATKDEANIGAEYATMRTAVRRYLTEMNVSPELFDVMQSIPPSEQHILSATEAKRFGLIEVDPVEDELQIAKFSRQDGISREGYRRRLEVLKRACGPSNILDGEYRSCVNQVNRENSWGVR